MQKQSNRGQDGVGVANIKLDVPPGTRYISRYRTINQQPIPEIFTKISRKYEKAKKKATGGVVKMAKGGFIARGCGQVENSRRKRTRTF